MTNIFSFIFVKTRTTKAHSKKFVFPHDSSLSEYLSIFNEYKTKKYKNWKFDKHDDNKE